MIEKDSWSGPFHVESIIASKARNTSASQAKIVALQAKLSPRRSVFGVTSNFDRRAIDQEMRPSKLTKHRPTIKTSPEGAKAPVRLIEGVLFTK